MNIHVRALEIAKNFKRSSSELINIIQEIDDRKAFLEKSCKSTYDYCLKVLGLSDDLSLDFIAIARKSKLVPELKLAIEKEEITVSKARRIVSVINKNNSNHWINLAQNLSKDKLQKEIVKVLPQAAVQEKAKYVTENRLKLVLGVSEEFVKNLKRAQDIISQKKKSHANYEETLEETLKEFVKRNDPVEKAKRADERRASDPEKTNDSLLYGPGRIRIPFDANTKHKVNLRDQGQCIFQDSRGNRCDQRKWLQIHHVKHVSKGGQNNLENLRTLCFAHHKMQHL